MRKGKILHIRRNSELPDYRFYSFSIAEFVPVIMLGVIADIILAYIFFRSYKAAIYLIPVIIPVVAFIYERKQKKRINDLRHQFRDGVNAISTALVAGYSVENAIREAAKDMERMYGDGYITIEFRAACEGIRNGRTAEDLFGDFARRSAVEDIFNFAEVFAVAKRNGGDMTSVLNICALTIGDKLDTEDEIRVVVAAKKLEGRIMNIIPCLMIVYIGYSSPGFLDILYESFSGRIVMTVCLILYILGIYLSEKITDIEV